MGPSQHEHQFDDVRPDYDCNRIACRSAQCARRLLMEENVTEKPIGLTRREWLSTAAGASALLAAPSIEASRYRARASRAPRLQAQASKVQLSMCLSDNDRTRPLREGRVKADGVDLVVSTAHPSEMFWRELHFAEFDISEMSCSSLLMAVANGDKRFVAVPVFTSRSFF